MFVSVLILPQRPVQSNVSAVSSVTVPVRAVVAGVGAVLASAGEPFDVPLAPLTESKPVAQTAPVARPTAPKASQAARRRLRRAVEVGKSEVLDTANWPFLGRIAGRLNMC